MVQFPRELKRGRETVRVTSGGGPDMDSPQLPKTCTQSSQSTFQQGSGEELVSPHP